MGAPGSGLSWQDRGEGPATYEVAAGDCLVHLVREEAHTLHAGPEGLDVLAFGERGLGGGAHLPRAGLSWHGPSWVRSGGEPSPWQGEAPAGAPELVPPSPRPGSIVHVDAVSGRRRDGATVSRERRDLGRAAAREHRAYARRADAGKLSAPPHCHSADEELFVVLDGDGTLFLGDEEHPVRPGTIVSRPAGTAVAHAIRAGPGPLVFLAYGTRVPNDICYYPRSGKLSSLGWCIGRGSSPAGLLGRTRIDRPITSITRPAAGEPEGMLVLIHGRGADEHDLYPLADALDPGGRLVAALPRGPLRLPPGGAHWYVVYEIGLPTRRRSCQRSPRSASGWTRRPRARGPARPCGGGRVLAGRGDVLRTGRGRGPRPAGIIASPDSSPRWRASTSTVGRRAAGPSGTAPSTR